MSSNQLVVLLLFLFQFCIKLEGLGRLGTRSRTVKFDGWLQKSALTHRLTRLPLSKRDDDLVVALTREAGANDKLRNLLPGITCVEIPCLAFEEGDDLKDLPAAMKSHDVIVITSPQAATTFLNSWKANEKPPVKIATVGKGTSKPLIAAGINIVFEPSDSTAETLAAELPTSLGTSVLYPSSAIAENTLSNGLESRGFRVTRLNTYNTVPAVWTKEQQEMARTVDIVTIASPSAAKIWSETAGTNYTVVAIGPTSQNAAEKIGYKQVLCPRGGSQGIEAWAKEILKFVEAKK